ncbi:Structural Maintenance Of Chromosomes Protein 4 [Manis pentadactyla]|nr:Structural Maintenance Of Chromosomes Protein 4 [Manis pentadactyla]
MNKSDFTELTVHEDRHQRGPIHGSAPPRSPTASDLKPPPPAPRPPGPWGIWSRPLSEAPERVGVVTATPGAGGALAESAGKPPQGNDLWL